MALLNRHILPPVLMCAVGWLAACAQRDPAPPPRVAAPEQAASAAPSGAPTASAAALVALPDGPVDQIVPGEIACESAPWSLSLPNETAKVTLCDAAGERCFLEAAETPFHVDRWTVKTTRGDRPKVFLELPYQGLSLRGFVAQRPVRFTRGAVFGGWYLPREVEVTEGRRGKLLVHAAVDEWVTPKKPLEQELSCDDVGWERQPVSEEEVSKITKAQGDGEELILVAGDTTLFALDGTAVATIAGAPRGALRAYQTLGARRLVVIRGANGRIFGWVPKRSLAETQTKTGHGQMGGVGHALSRAAATPETGLRCTTDVPLIAIIGSSRLEIGKVDANTWFTPGLEIDSLYREIELRHPVYDGATPIVRLRVAPGAKLAVRRDQVAACERR